MQGSSATALPPETLPRPRAQDGLKKKRAPEGTRLARRMFCRTISVSQAAVSLLFPWRFLLIHCRNFPRYRRQKTDIQNQTSCQQGKQVTLFATISPQTHFLHNCPLLHGTEPLLARRFRYYQATLDMTTLAPGKDYDELCESFIVFLCAHDPFDRNLPVYTLERHCAEAPDLSIDCNSHWIALNAHAWDTLPEGALRDLLHYTQNGSVGTSSLVQRIEEIVAKANNDRKWVDKVFYCVSTIEENDARRARILERLARKEGLEQGLEEGRERGLAEGRAEGAKEAEARYSSLVERLLAAGRLDDLRMAASDDVRRAALFEEFGL